MIVLFVDDNSDTCKLLSRFLRAPGVSTFEATGVVGMVAHLRNVTPDVIVTDFLMRGENGFDVLSYVQRHFPLIPVVLLSGVVELAAGPEAEGFAAVLPKPVEIDTLRETLERVVRENRARRNSAGNATSH